ncbi:MAG: hypothetical protein AAGA48_35600 [Myxococcota bacterium]
MKTPIRVELVLHQEGETELEMRIHNRSTQLVNLSRLMAGE